MREKTIIKKAIVIYSHVVGLAVIRSLGDKGIPVIVLHYRDCEMGQVSKFAFKKISSSLSACKLRLRLGCKT